MKKNLCARVLSLSAAVSLSVLSSASFVSADTLAPAAAPQSATISVKAATAYQFSSNLMVGARGDDVRMLQAFLNKTPATQVAVAPHAGSAGKETDAFGSSTEAAVKAYQNAHGIAATGVFGTLTRAAINAELELTAAPSALPAVPVLKFGAMTGGSVTVTTTYDGGSEAPMVWFQYGTTPTALTMQSAPATSSTQTGLAQITLSNIGTGECYVQAFVKNSAGTTSSPVSKCVQ